jgi:predicted ribosome quality control (RQC) complex YloA/Tae2 family protein
MAMDILTLTAVVTELASRLSGAAVSKIHQVGLHELVLRLWTGRENLRLLISAHPQAARLHLTSQTWPNPSAPPRFCQLLRARARRLRGIRQLPGERVAQLEFAGEGNETSLLVVELLGPHANLLLLDDTGTIVDLLHRDKGEQRGLVPGAKYVPPAAPARWNLTLGIPEIPPAGDVAAWLLQAVTPMTSLAAADLAAASAAGGMAHHALEHFRRRLLQQDLHPGIARYRGKRLLLVLPPEYLELEEWHPFASVSAAADAFYAGHSSEDLFGGGKGELGRLVDKALGRLERRLSQIAAEETKAHGAERQREIGDLLLANLHQLRRGMSAVTLDDWYADPPTPVTIELDPALSPQENAEVFFRRQRKGKRALVHIERRRTETRTEIDRLEGVALALDEADDPAELTALREELAAGGIRLPEAKPGRLQRKASGPPPLRRAVTPSGFQLIWGKNNRSNDHVSRQLTTARDLWFHAQGLPGCHLVLKRGQHAGDIPEVDVLFAASLAAGYSRGKDSALVEVIVAPGGQVRKPPGARPGLVTVGHYRTVRVAPQRVEAVAAEDGN